jgi:hypothetical protein
MYLVFPCIRVASHTKKENLQRLFLRIELVACTVLEFLNNLWGARNRVGIGLLYGPASPGGIGFLESILGLLKSLKILSLFVLSV